jgi:subtilisin-like proprotein convertase family protein
MTRLSLLTLRRFIRPMVGGLVIISAFVLLFAYSRTAVPTTKAQADDTPPANESVTDTFPANAGTLGAIPDGTALSPLPAYGGTRDVTFTSTLSGTVQTVEVSFTSGGPSHTFRGDLEVVLKGPGGSPSHLLFSRTNATTSSSFGSGSDLTGPYLFTDAATGSHWWAVTATPTTPGSYRTVGPGFSATNPPVTTMNTTFVGTPATGTWTLSFRDGCSADTGSVSAASLTITTGGPPPGQHVADFDGDNKTDAAVVRNTGGGPTGQTTWFIRSSQSGASSNPAWGIANDFFVPEDYDGDGKTDIAVWRAGAPSQAAFYILQSSNNTLKFELFGQTGDDPTVVGDYDNDNKADIAVYRPGATAGAQSTWYYRGSNANPSGNVTFVPWGQGSDFVAPGDYDGDGRNDFVVQRDSGGSGVFWTRLATGAVSTLVYGLSSDVIVPGDYDNDGKTDIAVARDSNGATAGGDYLWFIRQSSNGATTGGPFGLVTDFIAQGDYDGDGKTDLAIWRPSAVAGESRFWYLGSQTSTTSTIAWGASGDYPVANYNTH